MGIPNSAIKPANPLPTLYYTTVIGWTPVTPPLLGIFKLHINGCGTAVSVACAGGLSLGLAWDHDSWATGFSCKLGSVSALETEIWALPHGLKLLNQRNTLAVEIETDASNVINLLDVEAK